MTCHGEIILIEDGLESCLATSDGLEIVFSRRQWSVTRLVGVLTRAAIAL